MDKEEIKDSELSPEEARRKKRARRIQSYLAWGVTLAVLVFFGKVIIDEIRSSRPVRVGASAPDFTLPDLQGREVSLSDYQGKVVFLNVWATWCPPCRDEMPSMQKVYEDLKGDHFEMIAASIDAGEARVVRRFMEDLGLTFPALHDRNSQVYKIYQATGVPETFIIDHRGIMAAKFPGALDWNQGANRKVLEDLIEKAKRG